MATSAPRSGFARLRSVLWFVVLAAVVAYGVTYALREEGSSPQTVKLEKLELKPVAGLGGPFSLVDQRGNPFTEASLLGKPTLLFFGYTHCPDVCPTTLIEVSLWLKELGVGADRLRVVFISVDPERDTQESLAAYLGSFDPGFYGVTGSRAEIDKAIKAWRVYARKVPGKDGDYTMDHTAGVYLLDRQGRYVGQLKYQDEATRALPLLRLLLREG